MHTMKYTHPIFVPLVILVFLAIGGCSRDPVVVKTKEPEGAKPTNPFQQVLDGFRYPENPRENDDWTRFRDAVRQLDGHFAKADVLDRISKSAAEQRSFLENELGLNAAELAEVEATSFRTADAHYLDECSLLQEAARALDVRGLPAAEQSRIYFQWVMRNVISHEQGDCNTPPAFTLRRGVGSPMERALVFLALLRQTQIEGCLVIVPDTVPLQFLVAAHDAKTSSLRLFDTRLGLPVLASDGKTVATFQEVVKNPSLLQPSALSPAEVERLQPWIVCPLHALAPRFFELQRGLSPFEPMVLHLNAQKLSKEIAQAAKMPAKIWKADIEFAPADRRRPTVSPTRWLRTFLPKEEGGIDETSRAEMYARTGLPLQHVLVNYGQINVTEGLLPAPVYRGLQYITRLIFNKYELQPREMLLRGRHDAMIRRQERLHFFVRHESLLNLSRDAVFAKERVEWQRKIAAEYADLLRDPKTQSQMQQTGAIWTRDVFIRFLIDVDNEKQLDRTDKTTVMTQILAVGIRDYFDLELARARGTAQHEKAARAQATLTAYVKPPATARERANEAWEIAGSSWGNVYLDRINLPSLIEQQRKQARERRPMPDMRDEIHTQVSLLEKLHLDVHKYLHARLRFAECQEVLVGAKQARAELEKIQKVIETLEKQGLLKADIENVGERLRAFETARAFFQPRLDLLARDWMVGGNNHWLKRHIDQRIALLASGAATAQ